LFYVVSVVMYYVWFGRKKKQAALEEGVPTPVEARQ